MIDSKLEPQPDEGHGDTNCSTAQNKTSRDEGRGVRMHLGWRMHPDGHHLQVDDPGGGATLSDAVDCERLDDKHHDERSRDNIISMTRNTMPPDSCLQAEESGNPYIHLKRPDDSTNHVLQTAISKTADDGNDKNVRQACRTSSSSRHDSP